MLTKRQVVEAEFNECATRLLPIKGTIRKRTYLSDNKIVTPEMIEEVANTGVRQERQNKIVVAKFCAEVSLLLGSEMCTEFLSMYAKG